MQIAREYAGVLRQQLGARVRQVVLFGSRARGDADDFSDFDVLIVVDKRTRDLRDLITDAGVRMMDRYGTLFGALVYSENEWERIKGFPIGWNILKEGQAL